MSYSRFDWLRALARPLSAAGMEASWLYLWVLVLSQWVRPADRIDLLAPATVFLLVLAGEVCAWRLLRAAWSLRRVRLALVFLGVVGVLVAARVEHFGPQILTHPSPALAAAAFGLLAWWRGVGLGQGRLRFADVTGRFWTGLAATFVALVLLAVAGDGQLLAERLAVCTLAYFFSALFALALARLEEVGEGSPAGAGIGASRYWLLAVGGTILGVLALTLAAAQSLAVDLLAILARPLAAVLGGLDAAIYLLIYLLLLPVALLAELLFAALRWLIGVPPDAPPQEWSSPFNLEQMLREGTTGGLPPEVVLALKWLLAGALAVGVLVLLARAVSRWRPPEREDEVEEERESVWSRQSFIAALLDWLRRLRGRLFPAPTATSASPAGLRAEPGSPSPAVLSVREIYRALLRLADSRGWPRRPAETPNEYLSRLDPAFPDDADALAAITAGYVQARYSAPPLPEGVGASVRAAWEAVSEGERGSQARAP